MEDFFRIRQRDAGRKEILWVPPVVLPPLRAAEGTCAACFPKGGVAPPVGEGYGEEGKVFTSSTEGSEDEEAWGRRVFDTGGRFAMCG